MDVERIERRVWPTAESTVEAVMWTAREEGPAGLLQGDGHGRLLRCDADARRQIEARLSRLWGARSAREVIMQAISNGRRR